MTFYCPACWAEIAAEVHVCPICGADIDAVQRSRDYVDKLVAALDHPEAETSVRAAMILGERRERRAVEPLMRVVGHAKDAFLVEAAVDALGRIGDPRCRELLEAALARGTVRVRLAARRALDALARAIAEQVPPPLGAPLKRP